MYGEASGQRFEARTIKKILTLYGEASGQRVNFHKSSISSSRNIGLEMCDAVCSELRVRCTSNHGKYLGVPSFIGRQKRQVFDFLKDTIWGKIQNWHTKKLSRAGKEVLLKSVDKLSLTML